MEIIYKRDLIKTVAKRWYEQYREDYMNVLTKLSKIDLEIATEQQIIDIIGNSTWTSIRCDECNKEVDIAIQLGEEPNYESATALICIDCLKKSIKLFKNDSKN
jgi:hypothetical protein